MRGRPPRKNTAQLASDLRRKLEGRAGHAMLCGLAAAPLTKGIKLWWRDYLTRDRGPLGVVPCGEGEAVYQALIEELQAWRKEAISSQPSAVSSQRMKATEEAPRVRSAASGR
jgi:hypothetical protein